MTRPTLRQLAGRGLREVAAARDVRRLLRSGLLDRGYYETQAGRAFRTDAATAHHYLRTGRRAGHSPHPLYEPEWVTGGRPAGRAEPLLAAVRRGDAPDPGPLFDAAAYLAERPDAARHPGGALGHFAAHADAETPLPGHGELTWGAARDAMLGSARAERVRHALRRPRRTGDWDAEAERRWLATAAGPSAPPRRPSRWSPSSCRCATGRTPCGRRSPAWSRRASPAGSSSIVDDGSDDATPGVLAELAAAEPRVRV